VRRVGLTLAEAVLGLARDGLEVASAAGAVGAAALGLGRPVEAAELRGLAVPAAGADGLLDVVRRLAAATARGVRLVVTGASASDTFSLRITRTHGHGQK
jgi:hypothetical protein